MKTNMAHAHIFPIHYQRIHTSSVNYVSGRIQTSFTSFQAILVTYSQLFCLTGTLGVLPQPSLLTSVATMPSVPGIPQSLPLLPSAGSLAPAPAVPTTSAPSLHPGGLQSVLGLLPPVSQSQGLVLSSALKPIPACLVGRITSGQFTEMRDLLTDNIALHDQLEALQGTYHLTTLPNSIRPRVREAPSLISWVYCFMAYVATRTSDTQTRDMLTYCRLLIQEALRHHR